MSEKKGMEIWELVFVIIITAILFILLMGLLAGGAEWLPISFLFDLMDKARAAINEQLTTLGVQVGAEALTGIPVTDIMGDG